MSSFSISVSPVSASITSLVVAIARWGKSAWAALMAMPTSEEPRNARELIDWARGMASTQPALAAELVVIASRSAD